MGLGLRVSDRKRASIPSFPPGESKEHEMETGWALGNLTNVWNVCNYEFGSPSPRKMRGLLKTLLLLWREGCGLRG